MSPDSPTPPVAFTRGWILALVAAAALGAGVAALLPGDPHANPDSRAFVALARGAAGGRGLAYEDQGAPGTSLRAFRPPLYPLMLAAGLRLGLPVESAIPVQGALYGIAAVLAGWAAARLGGARAGGIAAALALAWWPAWLASRQLMTETLYTTLLAGSLAATAAGCAGPRPRPAFLAGLASGASLLARGTGVAAAAACGLALVLRRRGLVLPFTLGLLLLWAPWVARNRAVLGEAVWLQTSGGMNLWAGNTGGAIGEAWAVMREELPRAGEVGADRAFYRRTADWAREHPLALTRRLALKAADFLLPRDREAHFLAYRLALPWVLLGAWRALRDPRWRPPLLAWGLHALAGTLTVTSLRYRLPAELPAAMLAAAGLDWAAGRWGGARAWALAGGTLALGLAAAWAQSLLPGR